MTRVESEAKDGAPVLAGRYALLGEIAAGGMATVHYGRLVGPAGWSRPVAIKRLHPQYAKNPDFRAMFLDEARLASRIRHPNVVPILDVVAEAGELYLVLEFVEGEALSRLLRPPAAVTPPPVPLPVAMAIVVGMLEGLHAAHEARGEEGRPLALVHRDVSPQNVLVGQDGVARLIDFGIAKAVGNARVTREGEIKGKVAYMAPEQVRGEGVNRRTDVYAGAVVLWEVLTGRRLFNTVEGDVSAIHALLSGRVPAPSTHRADIAPDIDRLVLRGLSKDPAARFATASEMAQAIEAVAPLAAPRDVARWVERTAGAALSDRAEQIRTMNTVSAANGAAASADQVPFAALQADASSISVSSGAVRARRSQSRSRALVVAGILGAGAVGFSLARFVSPSAAPLGGPLTSAPADTAAAVASTSDSPATSTSPSPSDEPPPPSASAADAPPPASSPPATAAQAPRRPASVVARPPAPRADCKPPYEVTPDGVRKYKPQCLR